VRLVSVNVARPSEVRLNGRARRTAILKQPVTGPVRVRELGLDGDEVAATRHHGGPDQAAYVYGADDYAWWEQELGRPLAPATFGENLTIEGLRSGELRIGDRLEIGGEVVLEVTAPRIPCSTLAGRMQDPRFPERFRRAGRPGAYTRVIRRGTVQAGDDVRLLPAAVETIGLLDAMELYYDRKAPAERLQAALVAPVAERARADYEKRLQRQAAAR
jgi:MOSC domain-containing protein YiiM